MAAEFKIKNGLVVTTGGINVTGISVLNNTVAIGGANSADPYILNALGQVKFNITDSVNNYNAIYTLESAGIISQMWNANTEGRISQVISSGSVDVTLYVQNWNAGGNYTYERITGTKYEIDQKLGNVVIKNLPAPSGTVSTVVIDSSGKLYKSTSSLNPTFKDGVELDTFSNSVSVGGTLTNDVTLDMDGRTWYFEDGTVNIGLFAGVGTRFVVADASGNLSTVASVTDTNFATNNLTATANRTHNFATFTLGITNLGSMAFSGSDFSYSLAATSMTEYVTNATNRSIHSSTPINQKISFKDQTGTTTINEYTFSTTGVIFSHLAGSGTRMMTVDNTGAITATSLPASTLQQAITNGSALSLANTITAGSNIQNFTSTQTSLYGYAFSNTGNGGAISASTTGSGPAAAISNSAGGTGLQTSSVTGFGLNAISSGNVAGRFKITPSSTNTVEAVISVIRGSSGTPANGIGASINMVLTTDTANDFTATQLISKYTTATEASRVSQFEIWGVNTGSLARKFALAGSGLITADGYGTGARTGTATYNIAVDASGNFIETTFGSGSDTLADVTGRGATTATAITVTNSVTANVLLLAANPTGTTYSTGSPASYIGQSMGDNDIWKIYGESVGTDGGQMVIETSDNGTEPIIFRFKEASGTTVDMTWTRSVLYLSNLYNYDIQFGGSNKFRFATNGDFHAANDIIAFSTTWSDMRLKTNVKPLESALDKVKKLAGVSFDWLVGDKGNDIGFIAQEVEKIVPEVVKEKHNTFFENVLCDSLKTVNYQALVALLTEAIKEQQAQIDELKNKLA